ncbi:MAG: peptidoglycan editing factor PgeF [Pseudomonadota bacterium]|nr:peptidoglycan editing factor PgeF [Pseudomonadota bacterium]
MSQLFIEADWGLPTSIHALTTLRGGGISSGPYASMNPARHVGDDAVSVSGNRRLLRESLGLPTGPFWLQQEHGARVIRAEPGGGGANVADGSFSAVKGVVCAVMTADCLPVLLCNPDSGMIAAVHAGWRGLLVGVIESAMQSIGNGGMAWMGPAIGPDAFEVSTEVRDRFLKKSTMFESAFRPGKGQNWLFDIYAAARSVLSECGADQVFGGHCCTYSDSARFFSYRRDGVCGRMASLIWRD